MKNLNEELYNKLEELTLKIDGKVIECLDPQAENYAIEYSAAMRKLISFLSDEQNQDDFKFLRVVFNAKGDSMSSQYISLANLLVMRLVAKRAAEDDKGVVFDPEYIQGAQPKILKEYLKLALDQPQRRSVMNWKNMTGMVLQNSVRVSPRAGIGGDMIATYAKRVITIAEELLKSKVCQGQMRVFAKTGTLGMGVDPISNDWVNSLRVLQPIGFAKIGYMLQDNEFDVLMDAKDALEAFESFLYTTTDQQVEDVIVDIKNMKYYFDELMGMITPQEKRTLKNIYAVTRVSSLKDSLYASRGVLQKNREQAAMRVFPYQNKLWAYINGKMTPLSTEHNVFKDIEGEAGLVISKEGAIYIFNHHFGEVDPKTGLANFHSVALGGAPALFAGSIAVHHGVVKKISDLSGHYRSVIDAAFLTVLEDYGLLNKELSFDEVSPDNLLRLFCLDGKMQKDLSSNPLKKKRFSRMLKKTSLWTKNIWRLTILVDDYKKRGVLTEDSHSMLSEVLEYKAAELLLQSKDVLFNVRDGVVVSINEVAVKLNPHGFTRLYVELDSLQKAKLVSKKVVWPNGEFFAQMVVETIVLSGAFGASAAVDKEISSALDVCLEGLSRLGIPMGQYAEDFERVFRGLLQDNRLSFSKALVFYQCMKSQYPEQNETWDGMLLDMLFVPDASGAMHAIENSIGFASSSNEGNILIDILKDNPLLVLGYLTRCQNEILAEEALNLIDLIDMSESDIFSEVINECEQRKSFTATIHEVASSLGHKEGQVAMSDLLERAQSMEIQLVDHVLSLRILPEVDLSFMESVPQKYRFLVENDWVLLKRDIMASALKGHMLRGKAVSDVFFTNAEKYQVDIPACLKVAYEVKQHLSECGENVINISEIIERLEERLPPSLSGVAALIGHLEFSKIPQLFKRESKDFSEGVHFSLKEPASSGHILHRDSTRAFVAPSGRKDVASEFEKESRSQGKRSVSW